MKVRRSRLLHRGGVPLDASLYFVASEDRYVQENYFEALERNGVSDARRVKVQVLPTEDNRSSPEAVLRRLKALQVDAQPFDQFWVSIDVDRWEKDEIARVIKEADEVGFRVAVSNPCFEVWLVLHLEAEPPTGACAEVTAQLKRLVPGYTKAHLPEQPWTLAAVRLACARARASHDQGWWPRTSGSSLYALVEQILPPVAAQP